MQAEPFGRMKEASTMGVIRRIALPAALVCSLFALSGELRGQQPYRPNAIPADAPLTKEGWWIRVNDTTAADNVAWRFGAARNRLGSPLRWWKNESPIEFDLPAAERGLPTVHIASLGLPNTAPVSFCLFFADHGVALFDFKSEKVGSFEQGQQEAACTP
jgi:hypothetical protein